MALLLLKFIFTILSMFSSFSRSLGHGWRLKLSLKHGQGYSEHAERLIRCQVGGQLQTSHLSDGDPTPEVWDESLVGVESNVRY